MMRAIKKRLNTIAFFLTASLLFQSCVVYHKTPTTLAKASQERIDTKITNSKGEAFKYKYITLEDGVYYGVYRDYDAPGDLVKVPLREQETEMVLMKNKSASTWATAGMIAVPVIAVLVFVAIGDLNSGWGAYP